MLIDADFDGSHRVAQRMSNAIARAEFGNAILTSGICVATLTQSDKSIEDLLDRTELTPIVPGSSAAVAAKAIKQPGTMQAA